MALDDPKLEELLSLIRTSFRVREDHDPVYVDVSGHLARVSSPQFQVLFGRRGSGKSCLLVHYNKISKDLNTATVYVQGDVLKRLQYPDLLVRLVLQVLEALPGAKPKLRHRFLGVKHPLGDQIQELRRVLDSAQTAKVQQATTEHWATEDDVKFAKAPVSFGSKESQGGTSGLTLEYQAEKLDVLERHLEDYRELIRSSIGGKGASSRLDILVDDFYLIDRAVQPDVIDYLHRLTRGVNAYLKVGTVRHRTQLSRYQGGQLIGVELGEDMEQIDLDRTFEDVASTRDYLASLLNSLGDKVGVQNACGEYLSDDGLFRLTLASGGVPRDFLNIFVDGVAQARSLGYTRVTPKAVFKAAASHSYRTKLSHLKGDVGSEAASLERVLADLVKFCLSEKRKTGFLIAQDEVLQLEREHDLIRQLVDFKLIHVVEPDTSAASSRTGRFEAYSLDFSLFMEPRKRGIELMEFWKTDEGRRKVGVREAPSYPLARVTTAYAGHGVDESFEETLEKATEGLDDIDPDEGM